MAKKGGLGRGLEALMGESSTLATGSDVQQEQPVLAPTNEIDIDLIEVNPFQPRREFDEESLEELAESIRQLGLIQPITVRKAGDKYQLISGERRFRACKRAGLLKIPAYVRDADNEGMLILSIVENIQREDLNAIDIATGYQQLIEEFHFTQEKLSEQIGKNRSTITNYIRLLKLPPEIQMGIKQNKITMGHARALLGLENEEEQLKLYHRIIKEDLSVRKVEEIVRKWNQKEQDNETREQPAENDPLIQEMNEVKNRLQNIFGETVDFYKSRKGSGKITITFKSDIELNHILSILEQK